MVKPYNLSESDISRYWSHVDIRGEDECWEWKGGRNSWNYGVFGIKRRSVGAHCVALVITQGELGEMSALHTCDNPPCCNPKHLYKGNQTQNMRDRFVRGRANFDVGEQASNATLTLADVTDIRQRIARGERQCDLALEYNVHRTTISDIHTGRSWRS